MRSIAHKKMVKLAQHREEKELRRRGSNLGTWGVVEGFNSI